MLESSPRALCASSVEIPIGMGALGNSIPRHKTGKSVGLWRAMENSKKKMSIFVRAQTTNDQWWNHCEEIVKAHFWWKTMRFKSARWNILLNNRLYRLTSEVPRGKKTKIGGTSECCLVAALKNPDNAHLIGQFFNLTFPHPFREMAEALFPALLLPSLACAASVQAEIPLGKHTARGPI